jgi:cytochrome c556
MDTAMIKTFQVKVRSLSRILKEYKGYKTEVAGYNMDLVSQDKKQQEFYLESKSACDQVEKKLIEFYQNLNLYIANNQTAIEQEQTAQDNYQTAKDNINEVKSLLPAAC